MLIKVFPKVWSQVKFLRLLRLPDHDFAVCSPLNIHSILAGYHDFAARILINFAVSSPPVVITEL